MSEPLEYQHPPAPQASDGKLSLKLGVTALVLMPSIWIVERSPEAFALLFCLLSFLSSAIALFGISLATFALLDRRRRHPFAIVGFFLNLIAFAFLLLGLAIALADD